MLRTLFQTLRSDSSSNSRGYRISNNIDLVTIGQAQSNGRKAKYEADLNITVQGGGRDTDSEGALDGESTRHIIHVVKNWEQTNSSGDSVRKDWEHASGLAHTC